MLTGPGTSAAFALAVQHLGVVVRGRPILSGVSFAVSRGEIVGVLGPNGSGKTTLLEAIAGLRATSSGSVTAGGRPLHTFADRAAVLGYMPDDATLPEEATLGIALGLRSSDPWIEQFDVQSLLSVRSAEVSRGESKRAQLCAALALRRPITLLDEPFAAFDPRQLRALIPTFREVTREMAVVVSIHQMRTAELVADRLLLLSQGRAIAFGTLQELRARVKQPDAPLDDVFLALLDAQETHAGATRAEATDAGA